jgi:hypothetical protein
VAAAGSIAEVIERLERLERELPADDGVRWFNRLYLGVTRGLAAWIDAGGPEASPGFLGRLDVLFGNKYFEAFDAAAGLAPDALGDFPFHAWKPLFERRQRRDIAPLQFALAGMNAHINHDLAIGVQDICGELGVRPERDGPQYTDFIAVNGLIQRTEDEVKAWLLTGAVAELDRRFGPIDDAIAVWNVVQAREAAWTHGEVLFELSDSGFVEKHYRDVLDRSAGLFGRAILLPVGAFEGAPLTPSEIAPPEAPDRGGPH